MPILPSSLPAATRRWLLLIPLAGVLAYLPTVRNGFAFDDDIVIVKNQNLGNPGRLVATTEWSGGGIELRQWRPLTALTYAANHAVGGRTPWGYHLVNALLHGLTCLLLLVAGLRFGLEPRAAGLGALFFALHPIHVEAVANVVGRKDVLASLFLLGMLLTHGWAARRGGARLLVPVMAYAAAMASKEVGAVGLGLVLLWDWLAPEAPWRTSGPFRRRTLTLHASYLAAFVGYLALYRAVAGGLSFGTIPFQDNPAAHAPLGTRLLTSVAVIGKGLASQAFPSGLSPDWSFDSLPVATSAADPRFLLAALALAAWAVAAVRMRATAPVLLLSLGWYGAALSPAANVLFPVGTIYGERLLYLPSAGLALAVGWALAHAAARLPISWLPPARVAVAAALGLLAATTVRYGHAWRDDLALFEWAARSAPGSSKVRSKLAVALHDADRPREALAAVDEALRILPTNGLAEFNRSRILERLGRRQEAEDSLERASALPPENPNALYALGRLERDRGRLDAAERHWERAIALRPTYAMALSDLSGAHALRGDAAGAIAFAERAVAADPGLATAWYNLGLLYRLEGDGARARAALERFVETAGTEYAPEAEQVRRSLLDSRGR